ncbi:MAG: phosphate signaling complex protein PhoU [Acidobacteria bacterium]|nr:MAG: phosphate signaling complex protein PhoU [Acidobacteriota bacterium]
MPREQFQRELNELRDLLLRMGGLVETAVQHSLHAVLDREPALAAAVTRELEPEINRAELEVGERALRLMALQQPLAVDLRFVAAALKISNDLERMGDLAVNIAQGAERLLRQPLAPPLVDLPLMAERANQMLRSALDALVPGDAGLARQVLAGDDEVDHMRDEIFERLTRAIVSQPSQVEANLGMMFIARNLERIADHATNIAEDVIFWLEGVDVRHHSAPPPVP